MAITDYTRIANSDLDPESPVTSSLMVALRDNPILMGVYQPFKTAGSHVFTAPASGIYHIIAVGGGQGGDGGDTGSGATWTSCQVSGKRVRKNVSPFDTHVNAIGGNTTVSKDAVTIVDVPGGGDTGSIVFADNYSQFKTSGQDNGNCCQNATVNNGTYDASNGGDGASCPFGIGGAGGSGAIVDDPGSDATGNGAGGGGGSCENGDQLLSFGAGGMSGQYVDFTMVLDEDDILDIVVGAGGTGHTGTTHGDGGNGAPGLVLVKWFADAAGVGLG